MANAAGSVYRGIEGTGEATILSTPFSPWNYLANKKRAEAQNELAQQKQKQALEKEMQQNYKEAMNIKTDTPGVFRREERVKDINRLREESVQLAQQGYGIGEIQASKVKEFGETNRKIAKGKEIDGAISEFFRETRKNDAYDQEALSRLYNLNVEYKRDDKGKLVKRDVDDVDPDEIMDLTAHPAALNEGTAIVDAVSDIKDQIQISGYGEPVDTGIGLVVYGFDKKARFEKDENGQIRKELVDYVLETNPRIEDKIRWNIAEQMVGDPNDIEKVSEVFGRIQNSNDPSIIKQVDDRVRRSLEQLDQQQGGRRRVSSLGKYPGGGKVDEQDYNARNQQIFNIQRVFGADGTYDKPTTEGLTAVGGLIGGKLGGYNIINARPIKGAAKEWPPEYQQKIIDAGAKYGVDSPEVKRLIMDKSKLVDSKENKNRVEIKVRTSTTDGEANTEVFSIDLTDPSSYLILNNILNTAPGAKKIDIGDLDKANKGQLDLTEGNVELDLTI